MYAFRVAPEDEEGVMPGRDSNDELVMGPPIKPRAKEEGIGCGGCLREVVDVEGIVTVKFLS